MKVKTEEEVSRLVVYRQVCLHPKMQLQETKLSLPPPEILMVAGLSTAVRRQGHRLQWVTVLQCYTTAGSGSTIELHCWPGGAGGHQYQR